MQKTIELTQKEFDSYLRPLFKVPKAEEAKKCVNKAYWDIVAKRIKSKSYQSAKRAWVESILGAKIRIVKGA